MTLALYRKHRPKHLHEVSGQESNISIIQNAARENHFGHAYLFFGPRGTGKTTTARLLAKLVNCEKREDAKFRKTGEPCNDCARCREVDMGNALDVVELDAASNRGIDEIRNIKEHIGLAPAAARHKVYIIDEAHMLTSAAFNALLKTLEEPPAHGIIILATTELEKVPATIASRTQRFQFKRLSGKTILVKLKKIAAEEKISIAEGALEVIAAAGEGSMRDAESLLDQVSSFKTHVDVATIEEMTGRVGNRAISHMAQAIINRDLRSALAILAQNQNEGANPVPFARDLIHYLRRVLTLKLNPDLKDSIAQDFTSEDAALLEDLATRSEVNALTAIIRALIRAYAEMRYSPFASIPLEIALAELFSLPLRRGD